MNLLNESQSTLEEFKGELTLDQERDLKEESDKLKDRFESCFKQVDGRLKLLGKLDLYEFNREEEDSFARWFSNAGFCPIIDPLHSAPSPSSSPQFSPLSPTFSSPLLPSSGNASEELSKLEGDLSSFSGWASGVEAEVEAIEKKRSCGPLSGAEALLDQQKVTDQSQVYMVQSWCAKTPRPAKAN